MKVEGEPGMMGTVFVELRQGSPGFESGGATKVSRALRSRARAPTMLGVRLRVRSPLPQHVTRYTFYWSGHANVRPSSPIKKIMENIANSIAFSLFSSHEISPLSPPLIRPKRTAFPPVA